MSPSVESGLVGELIDPGDLVFLLPEARVGAA